MNLIEENDFIIDALNHYSNWADQMLNNTLIEIDDQAREELKSIKTQAKAIIGSLPAYSEKD